MLRRSEKWPAAVGTDSLRRRADSVSRRGGAKPAFMTNSNPNYIKVVRGIDYAAHNHPWAWRETLQFAAVTCLPFVDNNNKKEKE